MRAELRHLDILASLVVSIRHDWGKSRTFDMLRKARDEITDDLATITAAAVKGALTATNKAPDVLAMTGPHWKPDESGKPPKQAVDRTCPKCGNWAESHRKDGTCPRRIDVESYAEQCRREVRERNHRDAEEARA